MVEPDKVFGNNVEVVEVLRDTGENGFAVARLRDFGRDRVGIRWNGGHGGKGAPTNHGSPRWFLVPAEIAGLLTAHYAQGAGHAA